MQFFQEPDHILTEGLHDLDTFLVIFYLTLFPADTDVSV